MICVYFQCLHYLCIRCGNHYFKGKWQVRRHLQDQHSGITFQCSLCKQIYVRRNIPHSCGASEMDFVYLHGESGVKGDEARALLQHFINKKMDTLWKYVEAPSSPEHSVKSVIHSMKNNQPRILNPRMRDKNNHNKRNIPPLPSPATSINLGNDPMVEVDFPTVIFYSPTRVSEDDAAYARSLGDLTKKLKVKSSTTVEMRQEQAPPEDMHPSKAPESPTKEPETQPEAPSCLSPNLQIQLDQTPDEVEKSAQVLENIMANMDNPYTCTVEIPSDTTIPIQTSPKGTSGITSENTYQALEKSITTGSIQVTELTTNTENEETQSRETPETEEERRLRKEKKRERKAEKKRAREMEREVFGEIVELEVPTKKRKSLPYKLSQATDIHIVPYIPTPISHHKDNNTVSNLLEQDLMVSETCSQVSDDPIVTEADRRAESQENLQSYLLKIQSSRVVLNVGGRCYETSRYTLQQYPDSLFTTLFSQDMSNQSDNTHGSRTYFIDRDPAHFRFVLNYLRNGCRLDQAILPRERRYLLEIKDECVFYRLPGLQSLVEKRLKQFSDLGLEF